MNATSSCDHNSTVPVGLSSTKGKLSSAKLSEADYTWTLPPGTLDREGNFRRRLSLALAILCRNFDYNIINAMLKYYH